MGCHIHILTCPRCVACPHRYGDRFVGTSLVPMHIEVRMPVSQQLTESTRTVESRSYYGKIDYIKYNFLLSREPIEMQKKTHPSLPWKFIFSCTSCDRKPDHMKTEKVTYLVKNKRYDAAKFSSSFS